MIDSEKFYLNFFENLPFATILVDSDGTILDCNSSTEKIFGFAKTELVSRNFLALFSSEEYATVLSSYHEALLKGFILEPIEIPVRNKDGNRIWVNFNGSLINLGDFEVVQIFGQEITKQKLAQETLLESEERYRLISENVHDSISIINSDFQYEYVNESFFKLLGYSLNDLSDKKAQDLVHPTDLNKLKTYLRDLFKEGAGKAEVRFKKKNGEYIWIESKGRVLTGKEGKVSLISVTRDITEQKALEEILKSKSSECIFFIEPETRRIIETNFSLQHLLAYSADQMLELTLYDLFTLDRVDLDRKIHQILKERSSFLGEYPFRKSDGSVVDVEVRASIISYHGRRVISLIAHDITVRKLMEQRLEESERKYRDIIENVKDAVVVLGFDGKFRYQSPQFPKLVGREWLGDDLISMREYIHKEDMPQLLDAFWTSAVRKKIATPPEVEFRAYHKEGYYIWLSSSTKAHYDMKGEIDGYIVTLRDISEHKIADKKLKESEERYRHLFEKSPFSIILANKNGEVINCNSITTEYLGYGREDLVGRNFLSFEGIVQRKDFPLLIKMFESLLKGEVPPPLELQISKKDGTLLWVSIQSSFIEVGEEIFLQGILIDITDRKQAQQKLAESEEKYRELFENSPNSIFLMDIQGKIRDCNSVTVQYFGFEKKELLGQDFGEISAILVEKAKTRAKGRIIEPMELLLHKKDGSLLWASLEAAIVELNNQLYIQAIVQDITSRKLTEQKLNESEEKIREKSKLAAVGQLAAGVAHELNTPLANINLTAEYLLGTIEKERELPSIDFLEAEINDIKNQVKFCSKIVKELLQFSRKIEVQYDKFSIITQLLDLIQFPVIRKKLAQKKISISLAIKEDIEVMGDQSLVSQVIQNLIENSIDAFDEGSEEPNILISIIKKEDKVELRVKDNGRGIKKEDLPRIFEPFFTTKAVGKGTGLGLSISRGIIEKHGGDLTIKSIFGKGTEAIVSLPFY